MKSPFDLFRRLEREVRTPAEKLPIDDFLPSPDSLPTEFPDPPAVRVVGESREMRSMADEEQAREERRRQRRVKKAAAPAAKPARNLDEEISEFLNRDKKEEVKPEEINDFLGGFDPFDVPES